MAALAIVRVIDVVSVGLIAGMFLDFFATTPARAALSPSSFVQYQQIVHTYLAKIAQVLIVVAVLTGFAWLVMIRAQWRSAEFWLTGASTLGIVLIAVLTRTINVPINIQLMTWNVESPPANLKELWAPWDRGNRIRTAIAIVAFILAVVALDL